jgi:hypothetical protein
MMPGMPGPSGQSAGANQSQGSSGNDLSLDGLMRMAMQYFGNSNSSS